MDDIYATHKSVIENFLDFMNKKTDDYIYAFGYRACMGG